MHENATISIMSLLRKYWHHLLTVLLGGTMIVGAALPQGTAVFETSLLSAITTSDTSMTLVANSTKGGSSLSGWNCFTLDEGSASAEYACGTVSGTSVTGMTRGIDGLTGTTSVSSLKFAHRRGANVKVTDFPLIQILRNQLNGNDTIPSLMSYTSGTACSVSSGNSMICDKAYIDGVAVAGASNGNETTKGIWEGATQVETASSTAVGGTGAGLLVQAQYATSTWYSAALNKLKIPVASTTGKIDQGWLDLTMSFIWSGIHSFTATTSMATTTRTGAEVGTFGLSVGTTTATSSGNLIVIGNASTTNLTVNSTGVFNGWASSTGYEIITTTGTVNFNSSQVADATASCTSGKVVIGGGVIMTTVGDQVYILTDSGPVGNSSWRGRVRATSGTSAGTATIYAICVRP